MKLVKGYLGTDFQMEGNLKATRLLEVLKNARIEGDIFTPSGGLKFMIGGAFKGNFFVITTSQN